MIERRAKPAMVVILERHKAERLQHTVDGLPHRAEDLGHAVHRPGLRLKRNFDEVALCNRLRQVQQAAGYGYGLELSFGAPAIFKPDCSQDSISELYTSCAPRWVRLGEVGHSRMNYRTMPCYTIDY